MFFLSVNWLSIVLAAVGAWIFGGVYYSSTSRFWLAAQGKTLEQCQAEQAAKSTAATRNRVGNWSPANHWRTRSRTCAWGVFMMRS